MKSKSLKEAALNLSTEIHAFEVMILERHNIEFPEQFDDAWGELTYWIELEKKNERG